MPSKSTLSLKNGSVSSTRSSSYVFWPQVFLSSPEAFLLLMREIEKMRKCPICKLKQEDRQLAEELLRSGTSATEVRFALSQRGVRVMTRSLYTHAAHMQQTFTESEIEARCSELGISSAEAHKRVLDVALVQIDRLDQLCRKASTNRNERLLSEAAFRVHQMLSEVSYG